MLRDHAFCTVRVTHDGGVGFCTAHFSISILAETSCSCTAKTAKLTRVIYAGDLPCGERVSVGDLAYISGTRLVAASSCTY
eukprot:6211192-Pleurochrysis_carterae.AAC.2